MATNAPPPSLASALSGLGQARRVLHRASIARQRLHRMVNLPKVEHHIVTLKFAP